MQVGKSKYPFGYLWSFSYPIVTDEYVSLSNEEIHARLLQDPKQFQKLTFATTRPETMIGDAALAVHPEDARFKHLAGKSVYHPVRRVRIPIIFDPILVDMNFGTGCVKVTPAHDPNDFEAGKRNGLEMCSML